MGQLTRWISRLARPAVGGGLLLVAAMVALLWANSPWSAGYTSLSATRWGPAALHLDLTVATWATDALLAVFFFVAGMELTQEFVTGSLRHAREAAVPILAAVGGMAVPAIVYLVIVTAWSEPGTTSGWAVPTATDIAFALAVFAAFGRGLPLALRTFLLALAVVDDLLAIVVIAVFYTAAIAWWPLLGSLVIVAVFGSLMRVRRVGPVFVTILVVLAVLAWALVHASGVHATVAGVLLGMVVPARAIHSEQIARAHRFGVVVGPLSSVVALPVFAFFAAGVDFTDGAGQTPLVVQPVAIAVAGALVVGKFIGILGTTALVTRITGLRIPGGLALRDLVPVGILGGMGFTVSLLIAHLAFLGTDHESAAKAGILVASVAAAALAALCLRRDSRRREHRGSRVSAMPDF